MKYSLGLVPSPRDKRDYLLTSFLEPLTVAVPDEWLVWQQWQTPVKYQGGIGSCHDDQTEVLTEDGWKLFSTITLNDTLASISPETKEIIYSKIKNLVSYYYEGEICYIKHSSLDVAVTPNHKMLVRKWNESIRSLSTQYTQVEAKDLGWYSGLINSVLWRGKNTKFYEIAPVTWGIEREIVRYQMKDFLFFLGVYVAEGTLVQNAHNRVQIAAVKKEEREAIINCLTKMNIHASEYEDRFFIHDKGLFDELTSLGFAKIKAPQKFVPKFIFDLSPDLIESFIAGFCLGDGHIDKHGRRVLFTSSKTLADQLQHLLLLMGKWSRVFTRIPRKSSIRGRTILSTNLQYEVHEWKSKNLSIEKKKNLQTKFYEGYVYCAEVEPYHTLVTRRNGLMLISGNCVAFASGGQKEGYDYKELGVMPDLSEQFLYGKCKEIDGMPNISGTFIRAAMKILKDYGMCEETYFPYEGKYPPTGEPKEGYLENAEKYKITAYASVGITKESLQRALFQNGPVVVGISVYENFEQIGSDGIAQYPSGALKGGHAILIIGYNKLGLICKNSWSTRWGNKGYCTIPWIVWEKISLGEAWTIVDMITSSKPWQDWPDDEIALAWKVKTSGVFQGFLDGLFRPYQNVTQQQTMVVAARLGLPIPKLSRTESKDSWTTAATRGWIHSSWKEYEFLDTRWEEPLTRFQFVLLIGRLLDKRI